MFGPTPSAENVGKGHAALPAAAEADGSALPIAVADATGESRRAGLQACAAAAAEAGDIATARRHEVEQLLREQRAYAYDRAGHLTQVSRLVALIGLVAGGAIFTEIATAGFGRYLLGVTIPVVAAAEVVFKFGERAQRWREIALVSSRLLSRLLASPSDEGEITAVQSAYDDIQIPDEPLFHWAKATAWNVSCRERGLAERHPIPRWRALTRNVLAGRPDC